MFKISTKCQTDASNYPEKIKHTLSATYHEPGMKCADKNVSIDINTVKDQSCTAQIVILVNISAKTSGKNTQFTYL